MLLCALPFRILTASSAFFLCPFAVSHILLFSHTSDISLWDTDIPFCVTSSSRPFRTDLLLLLCAAGITRTYFCKGRPSSSPRIYPMSAVLLPNGRRWHCGALFFPSGQSERTEAPSNRKGQTVPAPSIRWNRPPNTRAPARRVPPPKTLAERADKTRKKGGISAAKPRCPDGPPPFGHRFIGVKGGKGNLRRASFLPPLFSRRTSNTRIFVDSPPITTPGPSAAKRAEWRGRSTRRESFPPA